MKIAKVNVYCCLYCPFVTNTEIGKQTYCTRLQHDVFFAADGIDDNCPLEDLEDD